MTTESSRKSFLAKLAGLIGVAGIAPQLLLGSRRPASPATAPTMELKTDPRTVSRREESV